MRLSKAEKERYDLMFCEFIIRSTPYLENNFTEEEAIKKVMDVLNDNRNSNFRVYKHIRLIQGKSHFEAIKDSEVSVSTQNRWRAKYNKEFGIKEKHGGKIGRTWKLKEKRVKKQESIK